MTGAIAEVTFTFIVFAMLALKAAVFVGLVIIGVRLANHAPLLPERHEWQRWITSRFNQLRSVVSRARHYQGDLR